MISRLIEKLKGVIRKMFNRDVYAKIANQSEVAISTKMINAIEKWNQMLIGKAKWTNEQVKSMRLEKAICREFANIVLSEMETRVENNEKLDEIYQQAIRNINENFQLFLGLGAGVIKPLGEEGSVEYIQADKLIPLNFDANGRLTQACFIQTKPAGDTVVYYRTELHTLEDGKLTIQNKAFKGTKDILGDEIPLDTIDEWANLVEEETFPVDTIDFGYYRNPIPNMIDYSLNGVSIFDDATESIKRCDIQNTRIDWEYESGERAVFADWTAIKRTDTPNGGFTFDTPKGKERLFVGVDMDDKLETFNPAIRDSNYIAGLDECLRRVEFNTSLAYGDLSKNEIIDKTATEIKASKKRKYDMVNAIQSNLKNCLEDLVKALAFYNGMYTTNYEFICNFHDSILTDEETERAIDKGDVQIGVMSQLEYRMKWYGEDEATAKKMLPVMQQEVIE